MKADFDNAQGFLYSGGLHFKTVRRFVAELPLKLEGVPIRSAHAVLSYYPEANICQGSVCLNVDLTQPRNFVYLHQVQCAESGDGKSGPFTLNGESVSVNYVCRSLLREFVSGEMKNGPTSIILEVNRFGDKKDTDSFTDFEYRCMYGILTGDEGWRHVPTPLATQRVDSSWTSRDFVKIIVFNNNYLLLNLNHADVHSSYLAGQYAYQCRYYHGLNKYFTMDARTAGVNHGLYFSVETGMLVKTMTDRILNDRPDITKPHGLFLQDEIKKNKRYRGAMIRMLSKVDTISISELGELDDLVVRELGVSERIESVRNLLELLESNLDLMYSTNTNHMVTLLTVIGLVFALIQVVIGLITLFG